MPILKITPKFRPVYAIKLKEEVIAGPGDYLLISEEGSAIVTNEQFYKAQYEVQPNNTSNGKPPRTRRRGSPKRGNGFTHHERIIMAFSNGGQPDTKTGLDTETINSITRINSVPRMKELVKKGLLSRHPHSIMGWVYCLTDTGVALNKKLCARPGQR
jgi:hypothetical protein